MGNPSEDPRRSEQKGSQKSSPKTHRVGEPGEQHRTSQENAGSTEGGGTRNAGNSTERLEEDGGASRERQVP